MNKRDIIEMCLTRMIVNESAGLAIHTESEKAYRECKQLAAKAGYTGNCFDMLWNEACKRHAHKLNVRERLI